MKKMRLDVDTLAIESFDTSGDPTDPRGTVHGHAPPHTEGPECDSIDICSGYDCSDVTECGTCGVTACNGTCYDASCGATYCGSCDACSCCC